MSITPPSALSRAPMRFSLVPALLALAALASGAPARAATIHVPADRPTIAAALADAQSGDTVIVADGTYYEHGLSTGGKAVTLQSANGPAKCIIDGQNADSVLYFWNGETSSTIIQGFTIQHGTSLDIGNGDNGGGIHVENCSPTIAGCVFTQNTAPDSGDGGKGGALYLLNSQAVVSDCLFTNNSAPDYDQGGAVGISGGAPTFTDCAFTNNSAPGGYGGAIYVVFSSPVLTGCTFTGNSAPGGVSGAMDLDFNSSPTVTDCIFWGDSADTYPEIGNRGGGHLTSTYSDVQGGIDGNDAANNIVDSDPLFLASPGDLRLQSTSPCVGTGIAVTGNATDLDGRTRPATPAVGAYEPVAGTLSGQGRAFSAVAGVPLTVYVATFTDSNAGPSFPHVTIQWGDGTIDTATGVVYRSGSVSTGYAVAGTHTYAASGPCTVTVSVEDGGAYAAVATGTATVVPAPAPPTGLAAATANAQTRLTWNVSATSGVTYYVYRGTVSGQETKLISPALSALTFTDTSPDLGTTDYYVVKAAKSGAVGAASNEASATASSASTPGLSILTAKPGKAGTGKIAVSYTAASGATLYTLYRSVNPDGSSPVKFYAYSRTATYTDTGLTAGTTYYYKVIASNAGGTTPSALVPATAP